MLILGMGLTGISCLKFFILKNIYPKILDFNKDPKYIQHVKNFKNIIYHVGSINYKWIQESELIIVSPGISLYHPAIIFAKLKGIEVIGDIELFVRETNTPIIAITGSNGKSTVATMVKDILKFSGIKVYLGGNIGLPVLNILNHSAEIYVIELSSFQLETVISLKARVATVLNISPDHMNRYPYGITEYIKQKLKIYNNAMFSVLNLDDNLSFNPKIKAYPHITFGTLKGDYHLKEKSGNYWLFYKSKKLLNTKHLKISGKQNYVNALSALSIVHKFKINIEISLKALKNFSGLPHRFQIICKRNDVTWINDSKSTNIGSTKSAIENILPYAKKKIRLILGGDGKSANFSLLIPYLKNKKIKIYCYGMSKNILFQLCPEKSIRLKTLNNTVYFIAKIVKPGDIVLLSPACSSLDQFSNFKERGNTFIKLIKELH
ncbi:MAG: UDP-N-acetylmuramoyl-L-alanine--D-glutamate ligase [Buchnera aphidicola (Nurudea shiraii)]